jgi:hypothetical protein
MLIILAINFFDAFSNLNVVQNPEIAIEQISTLEIMGSNHL